MVTAGSRDPWTAEGTTVKLDSCRPSQAGAQPGVLPPTLRCPCSPQPFPTLGVGPPELPPASPHFPSPKAAPNPRAALGSLGHPHHELSPASAGPQRPRPPHPELPPESPAPPCAQGCPQPGAAPGLPRPPHSGCPSPLSCYPRTPPPAPWAAPHPRG
ncbi:uncharacterized protein [Macaca nemestrina]|uniref:uncharacterized protein n=1 Tax=Macaca nemestrina TaxID=9545 RepID=UPI0039B84382